MRDNDKVLMWMAGIIIAVGVYQSAYLEMSAMLVGVLLAWKTYNIT